VRAVHSRAIPNFMNVFGFLYTSFTTYVLRQLMITVSAAPYGRSLSAYTMEIENENIDRSFDTALTRRGPRVRPEFCSAVCCASRLLRDQSE
jgi:hypothetical protein